MNKLSKERNEELERMINLINEVVEIYEQHQGEPQEKPEITCPQCQKKSTNYICDWEGEKHVHFSCECGCWVRQ
ncbi:hypothetical protein OIO07_22000 [Bacillus paralicheniformis]|uniref:hypothetical protein n=1 Tax=Bacillus TaxID=1386 RepID=UPI0005B56D32|nr:MULTISPECIES: hypothetical protein [Bacillus]AJO16843.1 hypothetical protein SC10_B2orf00982 [Bacillus paralicheniformis]AYQ15225.1 hypothetical protein D5285_03610 [Bacillus paralicheniformis]MBW7635760.1 hypothetical protein [Bacillus licheniformis]MCR2018052.1 hypothetical protein [Bacillus paralicheniformis]MCV9370894.1 hypothetical protein [Bacillus paralicheniformis]